MADTTFVAPPPTSWWQRVTDWWRGRGADESTDRSARTAYRQSLDPRFRLLRALALLAALGLVAGSLGLAGLNPISGVRSLWDRFFPRDESIGDLQATADPPDAVDPDFAPGAAVDGDPDTAWAASWQLSPGDPAAVACAAEPGTGGANAALVVTLPQPSEVSKVSIQPGLAAGDADRATQWRPTLLELRFDDGSCKEVELSDKAGFQDTRIDGPETETVRIAVLDAAPPKGEPAPGNPVTIGDVRLYQSR
jgi:hypothetical protein